MSTGAQFGADEDQGGLASSSTVLLPMATRDQTLLTQGNLNCESMNSPHS